MCRSRLWQYAAVIQLLEDKVVVSYQAAVWHHSNKYSAEAACEHCEGIVHHQPWCITQNKAVHYAYQAVMDASSLTEHDRLILHALGVVWTSNPCDSTCAAKAGKSAATRL